MISEEKFNEYRAYPDYPTYVADHRPLDVQEEAVDDAEIVAGARDEMTAEEAAEFSDESLAEFSRHYRGENSYRGCLKMTLAHVRDRLQHRANGAPMQDDPVGLEIKRVADEEAAAAEEEAKRAAAAEEINP